MPYKKNYLLGLFWDTFFLKKIFTTIKKNYLFTWIVLGHFYKKNFFATIKFFFTKIKNKI